MTLSCSVCTSPHVSEIQAALAQGIPLRTIEERYHVSRSALSRHVHEHSLSPVSPAGETAPETAETGAASPPASPPAAPDWPRLFHDAIQLWELAQATADHTTMLSLLRTLLAQQVYLLRALAAQAGVPLALPAEILPPQVDQRAQERVAIWRARSKSALQN